MKLTLPEICPGCGTDLHQEGAISLELDGKEWGEATGSRRDDGGLFMAPDVQLEATLQLAHKEGIPLTCAECGDHLGTMLHADY